MGFTPVSGARLVTVGFGGFAGSEQLVQSTRWVLDMDFTVVPSRRFFVAGEAIYGGEDNVSFRRRGIPFPQRAMAGANVRWWAAYVVPHYDFTDWFGLALRYGVFGDRDGARTGVEQLLQSLTFTPVFHLSQLMPEWGHTGVAYTRTRHPIHWLDLKLEYRYNHSNKTVFSNARPTFDILTARQSGHQAQMQLVLNF